MFNAFNLAVSELQLCSHYIYMCICVYEYLTHLKKHKYLLSIENLV